MPGYELDQFLIPLYIKQELICGICLLIFRDPVCTSCCRKTYCYECVNEALIVKNHCPNCRHQTLDPHFQLNEVPLVVVNIIANLHVRCKYNADGCQAIIKFNEREKHLESCEFHKCNKCFTKMGNKIDHNPDKCLKNLSLHYKKLQDTFEKEKKSHHERIAKMQQTIDSNAVKYNQILEEKNCLQQKVDQNDVNLKNLKRVWAEMNQENHAEFNRITTRYNRLLIRYNSVVDKNRKLIDELDKNDTKLIKLKRLLCKKCGDHIIVDDDEEQEEEDHESKRNKLEETKFCRLYSQIYPQENKVKQLLESLLAKR